ncbi:MAG TPA: DUF5655 domain-containing protein [Gemmata sp.]|nr:DUF5655 domain-containing protein [Gemmata sp.]
MDTVQKAVATQIANIEKKTGKSLAELIKIVKSSGLAKHGEIRDMLKTKLGLGHGDANTLTHMALDPSRIPGAAPAKAAEGDPAEAFYVGAKAALKPIHDRIMAEIAKFGEFEISQKKTYLSLRRKKQFAMVGPATNTQVEVGLNVKGLKAGDRLVAQPEKSMCNYKVRVASVAEVDNELIGWLRQAFDAAG